MTPFAAKIKLHRGASMAAFVFLLTPQLNAQLETKLLPLDGATEDHFGTSVAVSGGVVIVGSPEDDDNGLNSGSAYLFRWDGIDWSQEARLSASGSASQDLFGSAVDISGDRAIVGAFGVGPDRGAAYVFRFDGSVWVEEAMLTPSNGSAGDYFGSSVSIDGEFALVGAFGHSAASGAAYVFKRIGTIWSEVAVLTASDGSPSDYFGVSVSLHRNYALVGAWWDDDNGLNSGSAYVFHREALAWTEEAKLMAGDGATDDHFGFSVSITDAYALIGSYGDDDDGSGSGSAFIFRCNGTDWVEQAKLSASDAASNDFFGYSVEIADEYALIGSAWDDDLGASSGSAYLFHFDGTEWNEERKLTASDGSESDLFGRSVALSDEFAVSGAPEDDIAGSSSGSVYVYSEFAGVTSSAEAGDSYPVGFALIQNYPNPFNPGTEIGIRIPEAGHVNLSIYDLLGREITTLIDERRDAGEYSFSWETGDVPSGVYFYQLRFRGFTETRRMVILK